MTPDRGNSPADTAPLSARAEGSGVVDRAWTRDWFDSPNAIFRPGLSLSVHARLVYLYLCRRDADRGKAFPGYTRMAADCGVSRRTAIHAVQELCAVGLITYTPGNHERANRYMLFHPEDPDNTLRGATWRRDHRTTPRSGNSTSGSAPRALGQDVHQLVHDVHPNKTHDQDPEPNNNSHRPRVAGGGVVVGSPSRSGSEPSATDTAHSDDDAALIAFLTGSPVGLKRTVAATLVAQYPDRVRRVREYVAALSSDGRQRIQHWPGFVRRAVEEDFQWAEPERPEVASRSAGPLTALVCPDPGCGFDMLSTRPPVEVLAEPPSCPYCDRTMVLRADETQAARSTADVAGAPMN